jgi:TRAP-type C4-dicarboxylate transport system substrate-binding protein
MKLHRLVLVSAAALVFSATAVAQEIVIRIGGGHPTAVTYVNQFDTYFVPEVVKQAKAKNINVRFVKAWAGTVAKLDNTSEAVQKGALDIGLAVPTFEGSRLGIVNFSNHVPFGSTDYGVVSKIGMRMVKEVPALKDAVRKGVNAELLALVAGENYGMNFVKEVTRLDDLKGRKVGASYTTATWAAGAGAIPVGMGIGELYQALQTNLVEGAVIYESFIPGFKLDEVSKYWYDTEFGITLGIAPIMNLDTRKRLPKELVAIIDQVAEQTAYKVAEASAKREADTRNLLKNKVKVVKITEGDKKRWAESLKDMPSKAAKEQDGKGLAGTAVFKTYFQFLKEAGHKFAVEYPL